jgi:hypothetical protein
MGVSMRQVVVPCGQEHAVPRILQWQGFLAVHIIILVLESEMIYNARSASMRGSSGMTGQRAISVTQDGGVMCDAKA